ncbi:MAG: hypothetical protein WA091_01380 [Minisyncoccales bacterium]
MKKKEITIEDLAMMVQRGFTETKLDIETLSKSVDERFDLVDERFNLVNERFDKIDKKLDKIEKVVVLDHDHRIEKLEDDMKEVKSVLAI